MLSVTPEIFINESEIHFSFITASGPGGQNINKTASAVQLRFDVFHCFSIPDRAKIRLPKIAGKQMTSEGIIVIEAKRSRNQLKNRQDAVHRLLILIRQALLEPKRRLATKPTLASHQQRLEYKRHRSRIKHSRQQTDLKGSKCLETDY